MKVTDWQDQEYGPGDIVLYPAMSGRSVTMVKARVLDIYQVYRSKLDYKWTRLPENEETPEHEDLVLRVQLQPLGSSRWEQHRGKNYYIDNRTGKRIDPWRSDKHIESHGYRACSKTGAKLDDHFCANDGCEPARYASGYRGYHGASTYDYVPTVFKDYVQEVHEDTKAVTLLITENITKIAGGELP